jgi:DNA-binding transcriptional LysR family regulator
VSAVQGIDLAVRIGPLPDRAGLITRKLGTFDMVVCAAPGYLAARRVPHGLDNLADHDCLAFSRRGGRSEPWRFHAGNGTRTELAVSGRIRLDDLEAVADAAATGAGIACLPGWLVNGHVSGGRLAWLARP